MPPEEPRRPVLAAMTYREFMRASPQMIRGRTATALTRLLPLGEEVELRTFGALVSGWAVERAVTYLAGKGLIGGLATPALELRSLTHVILTDRQVLAIGDPSLDLLWSATRNSVRADRFTYRADGILRLRDKDSGVVVLRLHVLAADLQQACLLAEALGARPSRMRRTRLSNIDLFNS